MDDTASDEWVAASLARPDKTCTDPPWNDATPEDDSSERTEPMTHIPGRYYLFGHEVSKEDHDAAVWSNPCPTCHAEAGQPCTGAWDQKVADHTERTRLLVREVQDQIREGLAARDAERNEETAR